MHMVNLGQIWYTYGMHTLHLNRPYAIMMVGIPGSGKSFFATKFAETFGAPYIDSLALEKNARDEQASSELLGLVLGELAKTGKSFVFEGNSDTRVRRTEFASWARSRNYLPLFIWVQLDQATALDRTLRSKSMDRHEFARILKDFSAPHPTEKPIVVSGKHTYASQVKSVLKRLGNENRPSAFSTAAAPRAHASRTTRDQSITIRS